MQDEKLTKVHVDSLGTSRVDRVRDLRRLATADFAASVKQHAQSELHVPRKVDLVRRHHAETAGVDADVGRAVDRRVEEIERLDPTPLESRLVTTSSSASYWVAPSFTRSIVIPGNCGYDRNSCLRETVSLLRIVPGTRPANGFGRSVDKYEARGRPRPQSARCGSRRVRNCRCV